MITNEFDRACVIGGPFQPSRRDLYYSYSPVPTIKMVGYFHVVPPGQNQNTNRSTICILRADIAALSWPNKELATSFLVA